MENAKLFQNFIMDPENAALISAFARYANGIVGSRQVPAAGHRRRAGNHSAGRRRMAEFVPPCPPDVVEIYNKIWTKLRK